MIIWENKRSNKAHLESRGAKTSQVFDTKPKQGVDVAVSATQSSACAAWLARIIAQNAEMFRDILHSGVSFSDDNSGERRCDARRQR